MVSEGMRLIRLSSALGMGMALSLAACGGSGASAPSNSTGTATDSSDNDNGRGRPSDGCAQLANSKIPARAIALPTSGAVVTATQTVAASGTGTAAIGAYCLVSGNILPVDPTAPNIEFQLALPTAWNSKFLMLGGGGFDGSAPPVTSNTPNGPTDAPVPLGRGYAVASSDSGHQDPNAADGAFSVNQEAYLNFMGDALKKTRDSAIFLMKAFYGTRGPKRSYFAGGSTGGREALTVVQRWPADWDGAIALYPAWDFTALTLGQLTATEAFAAPGAFLDAAKRGVLYSAALAACDALDGASDGVISNVQGCQATFDPGTLRCPGGADTGDSCLSDAQLTALHTMNNPLLFNFELASGETSYPGYNVFIADTGIPSSSPFEAIVTELALGSVQPAFPLTAAMMFDGQISDSFIRYTVVDDPTFNSLSFDAANPGAFASRLSDLSSLDAVKTDLSAFASRGGKLLLAHGTADLTVSTRATEFYFQRLQATMDVDQVDTFVRFYEIPGLQHAFSTVFNPAWDNLTALENWVERGMDPAKTQIITDTLGVPGRTRPLCLYPTYPKYAGSGDINAAASFTCTAP
jgi:hypothetical protein